MKKFTKLKIFIPAAILFSAVIVFISGWFLLPQKELNIAVLNKTVPAGIVDKYNDIASDYRKHIGFFWLLGQQKYINPETSDYYDYKNDYYGIIMDGEEKQKRDVSEYGKIPDFLYLTDAYGDEKSKDESLKGISYSDIAFASVSHDHGSVLVAESDILSGTEDSVKQELATLFGVSFGEWKGRYIYDMKDMTDIPDWALSLYQQQYGKVWDFSGSGILLVSNSGKIVVLEANSDFNSKNLLTISISDDYKKKFGKKDINFYNWFELINVEFGTETVAEFSFDLNDSGIKKFSEISDKKTFTAVSVKNDGKGPCYYFAGDFDDYVTSLKYDKLLFGRPLYSAISYDREGDITNFYWKFYAPFMEIILKDAYDKKELVSQAETNDSAASRIENGSFVVDERAYTIKGFNINAVEPGSLEYTRNYSFYLQLISEAASAGANTLKVYDLLPPEFYRALYEYNLDEEHEKMYFIQTLIPPSSVSGDGYSETAKENTVSGFEKALDALHGKKPDGAAYLCDVSDYLLAYLLDTGVFPATEYQGDYFSAGTGEALAAYFCDKLFSLQTDKFGYPVPVGYKGDVETLSGAYWNSESVNGYNLGKIMASDAASGMFFVAYDLNPGDAAVLDNSEYFRSMPTGQDVYRGYISHVSEVTGGIPVLISGLGISTHDNVFEKENSLNGLSEEEQGNTIVNMLKASSEEHFLGAFISDLNDDWSKCSIEMDPFTVPEKNNPLWKNVTDPSQNTGVIALDPTENKETGLLLKDAGRMRQLELSGDSSYLYLTLQFDKEINYDDEQLIIGIDTYQRNNGEYLFDKEYFANSLSGMEFEIKFESKISSSLYVASSYNRNTGKYSSQESYSGDFDSVAQLKYGTFETSGTHFYQTGSTLNIRIPWNMLNFTDPVGKLVINDDRDSEQVRNGQVMTQVTNGAIFSVLVADKGSKDTSYIFPASKEASGFKTFSWSLPEKPDYVLRQKKSFNIIKKYFS